MSHCRRWSPRSTCTGTTTTRSSTTTPRGRESRLTWVRSGQRWVAAGAVCCAGKNSRKTSSRLVIARVEKADSGNYTCSTTNAEPSTISVYVSEGQLSLVSLGHVTPPRALIGQNVSSCHDLLIPGIERKSSKLRPKFEYEVHFNNPL